MEGDAQVVEAALHRTGTLDEHTFEHKHRYSAPVPTARYRCAGCGNLTRFDVTTTRRTRAFYHYTLGGELVVEDEEVLSETVEEVACRWCGSARAVETLGPSGPESGMTASTPQGSES